MTFDIVFKNKLNGEYKLPFSVYSTDIAQRWFKSLVNQPDKTVVEKDRMYNFPTNEWTEEKLVFALNFCIDTINLYKEHIKHRAYVGMPQDQLNHLHHYFETLRGSVLNPAEYFLNCTADQKAALERYNVIIHRAENFYHNKNHNKHFPRIVCRFPNRKRHELLESDYKYFTLARKFGEVYINYCEVGKPLYDVYKDGDSVVGDDNIRPLKYYSCDFTTSFHYRSQERVEKFLEGMDKWWDNNEEHLQNLGFKKGDPKNAIGNIPVAICTSGETEETIISTLCEYNKMDRIEI